VGKKNITIGKGDGGLETLRGNKVLGGGKRKFVVGKKKKTGNKKLPFVRGGCRRKWGGSLWLGGGKTTKTRKEELGEKNKKPSYGAKERRKKGFGGGKSDLQKVKREGENRKNDK